MISFFTEFHPRRIDTVHCGLHEFQHLVQAAIPTLTAPSTVAIANQQRPAHIAQHAAGLLQSSHARLAQERKDSVHPGEAQRCHQSDETVS